MLEDKNYKIVKMHICSFERKNGILLFDMNKYPERLCVHDKKNKIIIDVETGHKYPYVRVLNMQSFYNVEEIKDLTQDKRVGCMEYATCIVELNKETLKSCKNIIKLLQDGKCFPDGNEILSNEQYLEMINESKNNEKTKKIGKKGK